MIDPKLETQKKFVILFLILIEIAFEEVKVWMGDDLELPLGFSSLNVCDQIHDY